MKNARFWTGLVFCAGLPMSLIVGMLRDPTESSPVEGSVTYHGHAVTEGLILLQSLDRKQCPDIIGLIDGRGRFEGRAEWRVQPTKRTPFLIHILPDPRDPPVVRPVSRPDGGARSATVPGDGLATQPARDPAHIRKVVLGSAGLPERVSLGEAPARAAVEAFSAPIRGCPEIWLGPEPTRIEIDLKD